jgi:hypothetical protein
MTIVVKKNAGFIGGTPDMDGYDPPFGPLPLPTAGDKTSGMQLSTVNGVIGAAPTVAGTSVPGQTIGASDVESVYHSSVAINT